MSAEKNLQDIFGSDSDSDGDTPAGGLRISPAPHDEEAAAEEKGGSEAGGETPVAADVDSDLDEDASQAAHQTSGFTRVPSDNEEEGDTSPGVHVKGEEDVKGSEDTAAAPESSQIEPEPEDDEEIRIEAAMRRLEPNFEGRFFYWKVQDFLRADSEDFVAENYDDDFEDFDEDPPVEVQQALRQKVKTTMRWRWNTLEDGTRIPESNTKFVKWSDGSSSLVIGNEYYDISFIPLKGEHHQLFLRQGTGLQGGVVFKEKMTIRPAVANPLLRKSRPSGGLVAGGSGVKMEDFRSRRINYLGEVKDDKDPEKHRAMLMKKEEENLRATIKKETQQRRVRERYHNRGVTSGFLEGNEEEEENSISIAAIKNSYKRGDYTRPVYSDDDDSEPDTRRKKLETAKDNKDDDDEDDFAVKKKKTEEGAAKKRVALIKDDDESD